MAGLSPDGVLHVKTPPIRGDDPSVPSEVGEYMAQTSFWTLDSEQAIVMREMQKATPLARHLTAYFLRNDAGLSAVTPVCGNRAQPPITISELIAITKSARASIRSGDKARPRSHCPVVM